MTEGVEVDNFSVFLKEEDGMTESNRFRSQRFAYHKGNPENDDFTDDLINDRTHRNVGIRSAMGLTLIDIIA